MTNAAEHAAFLANGGQILNRSVPTTGQPVIDEDGYCPDCGDALEDCEVMSAWVEYTGCTRSEDEASMAHDALTYQADTPEGIAREYIGGHHYDVPEGWIDFDAVYYDMEHCITYSGGNYFMWEE